jgi:formylglycine-generating enzyme required for sulfatase activity
MWENERLSAALILAVSRRGQLLAEWTPPPGFDMSRVSWVFGRGQTVVRYTVRQRGEALYLEAGTAETSKGFNAPGSPVAEIMAATPYLQLQMEDDGTGRIERIQPIDGPVLLPAGGRLRIWTDYQEVVIDDITKPDWAEVIGRDEYGLYADFRIKGAAQRMRWIAPGEFLMGSPQSEAERFSNETQHPVILTQGYWLADTACTQALWQAVVGKNPSDFKGDDRPVETVSWDEVDGFIKQLNALTGGEFRLPTEAEWEYACRAGTTTPFWFGDQITTDQVNYDGNHPYAGGPKGKNRGKTIPVKALPYNGWGLYQMHGNVWEWCQDWYSGYATDLAVDPTGPDGGGRRVLRGGCWFLDGRFVRSASRPHVHPGYRYHVIGFRLARGQGSVRSQPAGRKASEPRRA